MVDRLTATDSGATYSFLTKYMRRRSILTLQPNLELYQWGSRATIPAGEGKHMFAPYYYDRADAAETFDEVSAAATSAMSAHFFSGSLVEFDKAFKFTRFFWGTHSLRDVLEETTTQITIGLAKAGESEIQDKISAAGNMSAATVAESNLIAANADIDITSNTTAATISTTAPTARCLFDARRKLAKNYAPGYADLGGAYAAVVHPDFTFHMLTNLSGGATLTMERSSMNMTEGFRTNMVGQIANIRLYESAYSAKEIFETHRLSGNTSGYLNYVFAPEAFFVSPLAGRPPSIIIHGFGSAGTEDPTNKHMTVGGSWTMGAFSAAKGTASPAPGGATGHQGSRMVMIPMGRNSV